SKSTYKVKEQGPGLAKTSVDQNAKIPYLLRNFMKDKIFLDTNVIVYAHDRSSGKKNTIAMEIMEYLWDRKKGVISVQVMQEFYVCVTTKILKPLPLKVARKILEYLLNWDLIINDEYITIKAINLQEKYRFSFWDSLIPSIVSLIVLYFDSPSEPCMWNFFLRLRAPLWRDRYNGHDPLVLVSSQ
ncbi:hypothetical protein LCGC14_2796090, partial [marine sediment metagenome]